MSRVKRGSKQARRRRRVLKQAKGYYGAKSRLFSEAREAVDRAMQASYTGRKRKKRDFRRLWITRINAASRQHGVPYSRFMAGLREAGVDLNRKVLAEIAVEDPDGFAQLATAAKRAL